MLLDTGYDVNAREPELGDSPLIEAARMAELPAVELLLERGADPQQKNSEGDTAAEIARLLLATEVKPSNRASYQSIVRRLS